MGCNHGKNDLAPATKKVVPPTILLGYYRADQVHGWGNHGKVVDIIWLGEPCSMVVTTKYYFQLMVPGTMSVVPGTTDIVPGTMYFFVLIYRFMVPGTMSVVPGTTYFKLLEYGSMVP